MALEQVFVCPRTVQNLRSGPLGKLQEEFCDWLLGRGFSHYTIRIHLSKVSHLNEFLSARSDGSPEPLRPEDVKEFLRSYRSCLTRCMDQSSLDKRIHYTCSSINCFVKYLRQIGLFKPLVKEVTYQPLLDEYVQWMRDYRHVSSGTLDVRRHSLSQFLESLGPKATPQGLSELTLQTVERFFIPYAQEMGRAARRSMQSALRTFFRFCLHQGYVQRLMDCTVPTLRTYKLNKVPRGLTDEQAQQVLLSINRNDNAGRRDYAICQLLYTYGVRGAQIRALRLEDIDWVKDQILFKASKQGKDVLLPLAVVDFNALKQVGLEWPREAIDAGH